MFATNNEHGPGVHAYTQARRGEPLVHGKAEANNVSPSLKHPPFFLALFLSIYENLFAVFFIALRGVSLLTCSFC